MTVRARLEEHALGSGRAQCAQTPTCTVRACIRAFHRIACLFSLSQNTHDTRFSLHHLGYFHLYLPMRTTKEINKTDNDVEVPALTLDIGDVQPQCDGHTSYE